MSKKNFTESLKFTQLPEAGKYVALYVRVSSEEWKKVKNPETGKIEFDRKTSIDSQTAILKKYAESMGWEYKIFDGDCGISGNETLKKRKALSEIVDEIKAGKIHRLIVRDVKRFSRNSSFTSRIVEDVFFPCGVNIVSTTEKNVTIETLEGRQDIVKRSMVGEKELEYSALRSMESRNLMVEDGTMRAPPALGYKVIEDNGVRRGEIHKEESLLVIEIFDKYISGTPLKIIAKDLNKRNITSKYGNKFTPVSLRHIIHNPIYKGILKFNGVDKVNKAYPVLIPVEKWELAQVLCKSRQPQQPKTHSLETHLLTGILQCGNCYDNKIKNPNEKYLGNYTHLNYLRKVNGVQTNYGSYGCQHKIYFGADTCRGSIALGQEMIERTVIEDLAKQDIEFYKPTDKEEGNILSRLEKQLEENIEIKEKSESLLKSIDKKFTNLEIDEKRYDAMNLIAKTKINKAENEIIDLKKRINALSNDKFSKSLSEIKKWDTLGKTEKKSLLLNVFDKILVYKDRLDVFYSHGFMASFPIVKQGNKYVIDTEAGWKAIMDNLKQPSNYKFSQSQLPE